MNRLVTGRALGQDHLRRFRGGEHRRGHLPRFARQALPRLGPILGGGQGVERWRQIRCGHPRAFERVGRGQPAFAVKQEILAAGGVIQHIPVGIQREQEIRALGLDGLELWRAHEHHEDGRSAAAEDLRRVEIDLHGRLNRLRRRVQVGNQPVHGERGDLAGGVKRLDRLTQTGQLIRRDVGEPEFALEWNDRHDAIDVVRHRQGIDFRHAEFFLLGDAFDRDGAAEVEIRVAVPVIHLRLVNGELVLSLHEQPRPAEIRLGRQTARNKAGKEDDGEHTEETVGWIEPFHNFKLGTHPLGFSVYSFRLPLRSGGGGPFKMSSMNGVASRSRAPASSHPRRRSIPLPTQESKPRKLRWTSPLLDFRTRRISFTSESVSWPAMAMTRQLFSSTSVVIRITGQADACAVPSLNPAPARRRNLLRENRKKSKSVSAGAGRPR